VGVVLALPSRVTPTLAWTIASRTLPVGGPEVVFEVGTLMLLLVAVKVLDAVAPVLARLAVGEELETVYVCVMLFEAMLDAVSWTTYWPPTADSGTPRVTVLFNVIGNPKNTKMKVHGFVTSRVAEPSSVAPAGPESTCQRQVVGLPFTLTASGESVVFPANMLPSPGLKTA